MGGGRTRAGRPEQGHESGAQLAGLDGDVEVAVVELEDEGPAGAGGLAALASWYLGRWAHLLFAICLLLLSTLVCCEKKTGGNLLARELQLKYAEILDCSSNLWSRQ